MCESKPDQMKVKHITSLNPLQPTPQTNVKPHGPQFWSLETDLSILVKVLHVSTLTSSSVSVLESDVCHDWQQDLNQTDYVGRTVAEHVERE